MIYGDSGIRNLYDHPDFEFIKGDICNINDVMDAIRDIDAVVHLAAIVGDPSCTRIPERAIGINYLATKALAETSKYFQVNRFIFASTCSVYGTSPVPDALLSEESTTNPLSLYAEMKLKAEQALREIADGNFSPTILRFGTLYGVSPRMRFDLVINLLTAKAIFDKKITIEGGLQWRPFVH
ncbi:MAG: NAD-dependent epimerase/dehydratase family protein, partial [Candidatus Freyrarchaeum guaymaensis]